MSRRIRSAATAAVATLALLLSAAQCSTTSGSGNPFGHCPAGMHRVRDVTKPAGKQWVCVGRAGKAAS